MEEDFFVLHVFGFPPCAAVFKSKPLYALLGLDETDTRHEDVGTI